MEMSIGAGIASATAIVALVGSVFKLMPSKAQPQPKLSSNSQNDIILSLFHSVIDISEKITEALTTIKGKSETTHNTSRDNNLILKEIKGDVNSSSRQDYEQGKRIETAINEILKAIYELKKAIP